MVSNTLRESAYSQESDDVWLVCATISHDDLTEDINVVNDLQDIVSNGVTYIACPFEIAFPADTDEGPPNARVRIDNVSQDVVKAVREINTPAEVSFRLVLASDPDTAEIEYTGLSLRDVTANLATVEGTLGLDDLRLEAFGVYSFGPTYFPGLF